MTHPLEDYPSTKELLLHLFDEHGYNANRWSDPFDANGEREEVEAYRPGYEDIPYYRAVHDTLHHYEARLRLV
jgi:hypothetical protein